MKDKSSLSAAVLARCPISANKLEKILAKPHDELSPPERALLIRLYEPPETDRPVQPVTRGELRKLLSRPLAKLTDQERATLIAFRGSMGIARLLLHKSDECEKQYTGNKATRGTRARASGSD